jgi:hypothetical protein
MQASLQALLTETVQQAPYLTQESYGTPTYGPAVARRARIDWTVRRITTAQGDDRVSLARVFLAGEDGPVTLRDQLVLPDGTAPKILRIAAPKDLDGSPHHYECDL